MVNIDLLGPRMAFAQGLDAGRNKSRPAGQMILPFFESSFAMQIKKALNLLIPFVFNSSL